MASSELNEKLKNKYEQADRMFQENSGEAWGQIRAFFSGPNWWLAALIVVLLTAAAVLLIRFFSGIRAPEIATDPTPPAGETAGDRTSGEIDDSNTVQPLLSGARKENCYTFLLFGTDKGGSNTDTIMVASYDVGNQKLNLMSIPRDTMVNVPWDVKKINSVYGRRGLDGFREQIAKLIGFTPDYYVNIDLQAFVDVVDLIGGVEFDVPIAMHYHDPYQNLNIDLEPGVQTLNGEQAMGLVRFRKSDRGASGRISGYDDTGRVATQQAFLKAMFQQCLKLKNWTKITGYVEIFNKNVESDLTLGNMLWFARQAMGLGEDGFSTVTAPCTGASAWSRSVGNMQSYVTLNGREMVKLVNERFNPYLTDVTLANLDVMGVNADGSVYSSTGHVADAQAALPPPKPEEESPEEEPPEEEEPLDGEEPADGEEPTDGEEPPPEEPPAAEPEAEMPPEPIEEPVTEDTTSAETAVEE